MSEEEVQERIKDAVWAAESRAYAKEQRAKAEREKWYWRFGIVLLVLLLIIRL